MLHVAISGHIYITRNVHARADMPVPNDGSCDHAIVDHVLMTDSKYAVICYPVALHSEALCGINARRVALLEPEAFFTFMHSAFNSYIL